MYVQSIIFMSVLILSCIGSYKYYQMLVRRDYPIYALNIAFFSLIFLIGNISLATFITLYYYYLNSKPGLQGPPGITGRRGNPGKNQECDICSKKLVSFRKEVEPSTNINMIDDDKPTTKTKPKKHTTDKSLYISEDKWVTVNNIPANSQIIGDNSMKCQNESSLINNNISKLSTCKDSGKIQAPTYLNGAIIRTNKVKNEDSIMGLQYQYATEHPMGDTTATLLGKSSDKWGDQPYQLVTKKENTSNSNKEKNSSNKKEDIISRKTVNISDNKSSNYLDFTCPKNSGIYKVDAIYTPEGLNDSSGYIKGIKFHCKDVNNGDIVNIENPDGRHKEGISFGLEPKLKNAKGRNILSQVTCPTIKHKGKDVPTFLSGVGAIHGSNIHALKFYNCSYKK